MMMNHSEIPSVHDVAIGALLHDIGKLMQRAANKGLPQAQENRASEILPVYGDRDTHRHALWSDAFFDWVKEEQLPWPKDVNPDWVRDLAIYHHRPQESYPDAPMWVITELVTVANRLASGYECRSRDVGEETANGFLRIPLKAIVASLDLKDSGHGPEGHHLPGMLDADALIPNPGSKGPGIGDRTVAGYDEAWRGFQGGWRKLAHALGHKASPALFEEGLIGLCEQWLWSVPSSIVDEPDLSLFDHSRTVAAFAAALYLHHEARDELTEPTSIRDNARPKFRLLVGDLSGLQSTLFRFRRERIRGLNRILRGRSLRFQFIADAGTRRVLQEFDMPWSAALQTVGGRFLILLPDLGDEEMHIRTDRLRAEFDDWMAREYTGDLGIGLALSDPFSAHDLVKERDEDDAAWIERANNVRNGLAVMAETAKLRQLQTPAEQAVLSLDYPHGVCGACGVRPSEPAGTEVTDAYCLSCQAEDELGRHFPKSHRVLIGSGDGGAAIFGLDYGLYGDGRDGLSGWRFGKKGQAADGPAAFRPGYCHVPQFSEDEIERFNKLEDHADIAVGNIKTFEVLAEYSARNGKGRKMLAVLMADVDRLGRLFMEGTGPRWNLARAASLSRMIDGYFSIRLPDMLEKEWPNIYTVYAGGDDLLLLGPWQDIFALASKLHGDFSGFSLGNQAVTLSAGIALLDVKAPVSTAAREARERLAKVKANGRNGISAIEGMPMAWDVYHQAIENAGKLDDFLQDGTLSTAALHRFLSLSDSASRVFGDSARPDDHAWRARLGYTLARNLPKRAGDERQQAAFDLVIRLFGLDRHLSGALEDSAGVRLALCHALYRNR